MKTMKRALALLLCVCMLTGTLVLTGAAEDKQQIELNQPVVTVTKADGLKVFELKLDFYPDENAESAAAPVFTDYNKDAKIDGKVVWASSSGKGTAISTFTAQPVAWDAEDGVLTVSLSDANGNAGTKLFVLRQTPMYEASNENVQLLVDQYRDMLPDMLSFVFDFPQGLLQGDGAENAAAGFEILGNAIQNIPAMEVKVYGNGIFKRLDRIIDWGFKLANKYVEKHGKVDVTKWPGSMIYKLFVKFGEELDNGVVIENGKAHINWNFTTVVVLGVGVAFVGPSVIPFAFRLMHATQQVLKEYKNL